MKKEVIETAQNIIGLYNAYAENKMENDIKKVIANPEQYVEEIEYITSMCDTLFDGHTLVESLILNRKQIKSFWKQLAEIKEEFIMIQEYLTGYTYRIDVQFTAFLDILWHYRVRFAVENKRVTDYTPVDFCLIKGRALQLAKLDKAIEFEKYNNIFEFMSTLSSCLVA